ncbi:MAG: hypothetical protein BI182_07485 [Acetobacterium sp. MES1]|uniref:hypothetical protein n=1 Tax=Acetobacterium sp. MES1 TaxID=1899015 RepID=UPI000B9C9D94|nr:hypothetical protein [Acetobacterium sp. MES1]OXS27510.1 MAG: hypothetical protein BI182_07485 [Acetobacterium sp. MES1]
MIRSIGTAVAPAIMVGFIAHAGLSVQSNVMNLLPTEVSVPTLPYAQELTDEFNQLKSNENIGDQLATVSLPDLTAKQTIEINMNENSGNDIPEELVALMKESDVTTITENSKTFAARMFAIMMPDTIAEINTGIDNGINGLNTGITQLDGSIAALSAQQYSAQANQAQMGIAIDAMADVKNQLTTMVNQMTIMKNAVPEAFESSKNDYLAAIDSKKTELENEFQKTLNYGFKQVYWTVAIASVLALMLLGFYQKKSMPEEVQWESVVEL